MIRLRAFFAAALLSAASPAAFADCSFQVQTSPLPPLPGRLVYEACESKCDTAQIYLYDFENPGAGPQQIVPNGSNISNPKNPVLSPNGNAVLFGATLNGAEQDLFYWVIGSSTFYNLTHSRNERDEDGKFSPDGSEVVWKVTNNSSITQIMTAPLTLPDGVPTLGARTEIAKGTFMTPSEPSAPVFSPTRKYIYYYRGSMSAAKIWRYDSLNGSVKPLAEPPNTEFYYPVDPDLYDFFYVSWPDPNSMVDKIYVRSTFTNRSLIWNAADCGAGNADPAPADEDYFFYARTPLGGNASLYLGQLSTGFSWSLDSLGLNNPTGDKEGANYNAAGRSWPAPARR